MSEAETRLTDVRLNQNKPKLIIGLILIVVGMLFAFLDFFTGRIVSIIGAVSFGVIGSYMLATSQRLGKDIAIKLTETLKLKAGVKMPKIDKDEDITEEKR